MVIKSAQDGCDYWNKSNDLKEAYREKVRKGIKGEELEISISEIKNFLSNVIGKTAKAIESAKDKNGNLSTYFSHEVTEYERLEKDKESESGNVLPLKFKRHDLPQFLEGYVHLLRVIDSNGAKEIYCQVKKGGLFDKELGMYKVNADLSSQSEEIGRGRIFPPGWLENESVWLHMEYKYLLELLRCGLKKEFFSDFKNCLIPFQKPERYGRSILENSSFLVSSAHEDKSMHGQGFVARLSGSTAELIHIWLFMSFGANPFCLNDKKELTLSFDPSLPGWMFTTEESEVVLTAGGSKSKLVLPESTYAANFLGDTLVVYYNNERRDLITGSKEMIKKIEIFYTKSKKPVVINSGVIPEPYSRDIRERKVARINVFF
ncbi:MAG: hypothetical protein HQL27_07580 [Candidatus Omnitrophica bacterium]|nr:hypothetical protein [Candidatus Omnitrophota bacterium]